MSELSSIYPWPILSFSKDWRGCSWNSGVNHYLLAKRPGNSICVTFEVYWPCFMKMEVGLHNTHASEPGNSVCVKKNKLFSNGVRRSSKQKQARFDRTGGINQHYQHTSETKNPDAHWHKPWFISVEKKKVRFTSALYLTCNTSRYLTCG